MRQMLRWVMSRQDDFPAEPLAGSGISGQPGLDELQGHPGPQRTILGLGDHAHPSASDDAPNFEPLVEDVPGRDQVRGGESGSGQWERQRPGQAFGWRSTSMARTLLLRGGPAGTACSWSRNRSSRALTSIVQAKPLPQVDAPGPGRGGQLAGCPLLEHLAVGDEVGPVADAEGILDVVVGDQDAQPTLPQ
jgi:hypothetical protein